jgi:hypothetical protein
MVTERIGRDPYSADHYFLDLKDAVSYAKTKGQFARLIAIQHSVSGSKLEKVANSPYKSQIKRGSWRFASGNHATWHQVSEGNGFWEWQGEWGFGTLTAQKGLTNSDTNWERIARDPAYVQHRKTLLKGLNFAIYGVVDNYSLRPSKSFPVGTRQWVPPLNGTLNPTPAPRNDYLK